MEIATRRVVSFRELRRTLVIAAAARVGLDERARAWERRGMQRRHARFVRVLFLHGTPAIHKDSFRRQLDWLCDRFTVIDFATFKALFDGGVAPALDRPAAMLTFDDGILSNYTVAAPLLEEAGIRSVFFVIPAFSQCRSDAEARRFYRQRVRDVQPPFFERPMSPQQIRDLVDRGHTIGNHTFSHARLSETVDADYHHEIVDSAAILESWCGCPVEAFAWPLIWDGITPTAHQLICAHHHFCFTPCHGRVDPRIDSPRLLWRTNIEPHSAGSEFRFQCSALADGAAFLRRRHLRRLLSASPATHTAAIDTDETIDARARCDQHCH
jgi:hypothetical protein